MKRIRTFQAGGNLGGDLDQYGRPVIDGAWYIAIGDPYDRATTEGGPFPDRAAAEAALAAVLRAALALYDAVEYGEDSVQAAAVFVDAMERLRRGEGAR